jgi:hypothetical protein
MLTGDTITDEQIRALRESFGMSVDPTHERIRWVCGCALGEPGYRADARFGVRARCAEVINLKTQGLLP